MARKKDETIESVEKNQVENTLATIIAKALNDNYKKSIGKVIYEEGDFDSPSNIIGYCPTGCDMLDLAISNKPNGGLPYGRIIEITGLEGSGKSLLAATICANNQKAGGISIYFDTEAAVFEEFFRALGVDTSKNWRLINTLYELETIFEAIEIIVAKIRENDTKKPVVIVIDSIMGATTKVESAADYDKDGWATAKAIVLSKAMRKITKLIATEKILLVLTNQLRVNLGVSFGEKYSTSGGKAVAFHSSVRLRLKSKGQIKIKKTGPDPIAGVMTDVKVIKNRLGPPGRTVVFDIYFDSGIDNYGSWLNTMKDYGIVKQSGAYYMYDYVDKSTGEVKEIKFMSKDFRNLISENNELKDSMYSDLCDKYIMKYQVNEDFGIDDIEITDVDEEIEL